MEKPCEISITPRINQLRIDAFIIQFDITAFHFVKGKSTYLMQSLRKKKETLKQNKGYIFEKTVQPFLRLFYKINTYMEHLCMPISKVNKIEKIKIKGKFQFSDFKQGKMHLGPVFKNVSISHF